MNNKVVFAIVLLLSTSIQADEIKGAFGFQLGAITSIDGTVPQDGKPSFVQPSQPMDEFSQYWLVLTPKQGRIAEIGAKGWSGKNCKDVFDRLSTILFQKYARRPSEDRLMDRLADFAKYDRQVFATTYGRYQHYHVRVDDREARLDCDTNTGELKIEYWHHDLRRKVYSESVETTNHSL